MYVGGGRGGSEDIMLIGCFTMEHQATQGAAVCAFSAWKLYLTVNHQYGFGAFWK